MMLLRELCENMNSSYSIYHCDNAQFYRYYPKAKSDLRISQIFVKLQAKESKKKLSIVPLSMNYSNCVVCFLEELRTHRHHYIVEAFSFLAPMKGRNMNFYKPPEKSKSPAPFRRKCPHSCDPQDFTNQSLSLHTHLYFFCV